MILEYKLNLPLACISVTDAVPVLSDYREWSGNETATMIDLYNFLTNPSSERRIFLSTLSITDSVDINFINQKIE